MSRSVPLLDLFKVELSVNLGRRDARVAKKFLHGSEVCPAPEQVHRVGVAEVVRRYVLQPGLDTDFV